MKILNKLTVKTVRIKAIAKARPKLVSTSKNGIFRLNRSAFDFFGKPTHIEFRADNSGRVFMLASNNEKTGFRVSVNEKSGNFYFSSLALANEFFEELPGKMMVMTDSYDINVDVGQIEPVKAYPVEFI